MSQRSQQALRQTVAAAAARILAEEGGSNPQQARNKALQQLGLERQRHALPELYEIEQELKLYQSLYQADEQPQQLRTSRENALQAMQWLADFKPLLYGSVLSGTANSNSPVQLLIYTDEAETVLRFLLQQQVGYESSEISMDFGQGRESIASCHFQAGEQRIELCFPPWKKRHMRPFDVITGKPQQQADLSAVQELLNQID